MRTTIARIVLMAIGAAFGVFAGGFVGLPLPAHVAVAIVCAGLLGMIPQKRRVVAVPMAPAKAAAPKAETPAPPADPESNMPRWRRPSVQAARRGKMDTARAPMRFDARKATYEAWEDETDELDGKEILRVRSAVAALIDVPDEVLGDALAELIRNDEVAVLDTKGPFRFVTCPDGRRGWIHRSALVGGADEPATPDPDAPAVVGAGAR